MKLLAEAAEGWLTPNAYFPRERPPTPFHYLFRCNLSFAGKLAAKLSAAEVAHEML